MVLNDTTLLTMPEGLNSAEDVSAFKTALKAAGYDPGSTSGVYDKATADAYSAYLNGGPKPEQGKWQVYQRAFSKDARARDILYTAQAVRDNFGGGSITGAMGADDVRAALGAQGSQGSALSTADTGAAGAYVSNGYTYGASFPYSGDLSGVSASSGALTSSLYTPITAASLSRDQALAAARAQYQGAYERQARLLQDQIAQQVYAIEEAYQKKGMGQSSIVEQLKAAQRAAGDEQLAYLAEEYERQVQGYAAELIAEDAARQLELQQFNAQMALEAYKLQYEIYTSERAYNDAQAKKTSSGSSKKSSSSSAEEIRKQLAADNVARILYNSAGEDLYTALGYVVDANGGKAYDDAYGEGTSDYVVKRLKELESYKSKTYSVGG
jgi:hypothetical protein